MADVAIAVASAAAAAAVLVITGGRTGAPRLRHLTGSHVLGVGREVGERASGTRTSRTERLPSSLGGAVPATQAQAVMPPAGTGAGGPDAGLRLVAAVMAGAGVAVVLGGVLGVFGGIGAAAGAYVVLGRLEPRAVRERRERIVRDAPSAASLLAAAVAAGATPVAALEVVAVAVGGPLGHDLFRLAASARLGGDFPVAPGGAAEPVARLSRVIARAIASGAPLAAALDRLAADLHAERRFEVDRRARSVGVRAAAPLGLCFLPGFLLIGVIPVIVGLASAVLGTVL